MISYTKRVQAEPKHLPWSTKNTINFAEKQRKFVRGNKKNLCCCFSCWNHHPLLSRTSMFREKTNCMSTKTRHQSSISSMSDTLSSMFDAGQTLLIVTLPNVNSFVGKPDAERAVTKAQGPGIGITGIPLLEHNMACIIFLNNVTEEQHVGQYLLLFSSLIQKRILRYNCFLKMTIIYR